MVMLSRRYDDNCSQWLKNEETKPYGNKLGTILAYAPSDCIPELPTAYNKRGVVVIAFRFQNSLRECFRPICYLLKYIDDQNAISTYEILAFQE
jgi:hypothetical protein